jgi:hypothetical protein
MVPEMHSTNDTALLLVNLPNAFSRMENSPSHRTMLARIDLKAHGPTWPDFLVGRP